jgi:predicted dithiol-disulfide oxidoreductase (DUF899 family)
MPHVYLPAHILGRDHQKPSRASRPRRRRPVADRTPLDFKKERGWQNLQIYSDINGGCTRTYVSADDTDVSGLNVFTRLEGTIHHFWSEEMSDQMADPVDVLRGAPDIDPLWTILDLTPGSRGATWYPELEYKVSPLTTIK